MAGKQAKLYNLWHVEIN